MPPAKLYKYRSLGGDAFKYTQAIFARRQVFLAQVRQFNDPFEGKFRLTSGLSNEDMLAKMMEPFIATCKLKPALVPSFRGAWIDRRTKHGGDGSDHVPVWVEMDL